MQHGDQHNDVLTAYSFPTTPWYGTDERTKSCRCRSLKKDGQPCSMVINTAMCQACEYTPTPAPYRENLAQKKHPNRKILQ